MLVLNLILFSESNLYVVVLDIISLLPIFPSSERKLNFVIKLFKFIEVEILKKADEAHHALKRI